MTLHHAEPPWEYLCTASDESLRGFELARLNLASNLRKQVAGLVDLWVEETAAALLARWMLEHRALLADSADFLPEAIEPQTTASRARAPTLAEPASPRRTGTCGAADAA